MNPKTTIICPGCGWLGTSAGLFSSDFQAGICPKCSYYRDRKERLKTISELFEDEEIYGGVNFKAFLGTLFKHYLHSEWGRERDTE